mgnify:CR=1 FL=1
MPLRAAQAAVQIAKVRLIGRDFDHAGDRTGCADRADGGGADESDIVSRHRRGLTCPPDLQRSAHQGRDHCMRVFIATGNAAAEDGIGNRFTAGLVKRVELFCGFPQHCLIAGSERVKNVLKVMLPVRRALGLIRQGRHAVLA